MSNNKSDSTECSEKGWPFAGQNLHNTRNQSWEKRINANNVQQLAPPNGYLQWKGMFQLIQQYKRTSSMYRTGQGLFI